MILKLHKRTGKSNEVINYLLSGCCRWESIPSQKGCPSKLWRHIPVQRLSRRSQHFSNLGDIMKATQLFPHCGTRLHSVEGVLAGALNDLLSTDFSQKLTRTCSLSFTNSKGLDRTALAAPATPPAIISPGTRVSFYKNCILTSNWKVSVSYSSQLVPYKIIGGKFSCRACGDRNYLHRASKSHTNKSFGTKIKPVR